MLNYYQSLGLKTDATTEEIRHAYRNLMRKYHPDLSELPREEATQKSAEINQAYRTLVDPKKRQDYDSLLKLRGEKIPVRSTEPVITEKPSSNSPTPPAAQSGSSTAPPFEPSGDGAGGFALSDEEFLALLSDRQKYKAMIDKYYSIHSTTFKPNWANVDMHKYLRGKAEGASSVTGIESDTLDFYDVELSGSDWSELIVEKIAFRNSNLKGVNFQNAFIFDCEFNGCDLTGTNLTGAFIQNPRKIQNCNFSNCKFDKVVFRGQIVMIHSCNFKGASGKGMDFTDLSKPARFKQSLKDQVMSCLQEQHWRNASTADIVRDIESARPQKKGFWPFGKK
jgi:curved DNA-binding protein CbpA